MDDLLQIGKTLRTTREQSQLSVEDATHRTRIPLKIIRALEDDDYSIFSSSTYARGYLSQYSRFLEIDPAPWLDALEPAQFVHDNHGFSIFDNVEVRHVTQHAKSQLRTRWVPSLLGILIASAVVYGGYRLVQNFEGTQQQLSGDKTPQGSPENAGITQDQGNPQTVATNVAATSSAAESTVAKINPTLANELAPKANPVADITPTAPPRAIIIEEEDE